MKKLILNFVKNNLVSVNCYVKRGCTRNAYVIVFDDIICGSHLRSLIFFCHASGFQYFITPSFDGFKVEFLIYK